MPYSRKSQTEKQLQGANTTRRLEVRLDRESESALVLMHKVLQASGRNYSLSVILRLGVRELYRRHIEGIEAINASGVSPEDRKVNAVALVEILALRCQKAAEGAACNFEN